MKFNDIKAEEWEALQPYLDTCLLPLTGLTGLENPVETTQALERLRDVLDPVEAAFRGRIVTYPAFHYTGGSGHAEPLAASVNRLCLSLKSGSFRYVIVIAPAEVLASLGGEGPFTGADLCLDDAGRAANQYAAAEEIKQKIVSMWQRG